MSIQELSGDTRSRQKFAKASSPEDPHLICKLIGTEILGWIDFGWPGQSEFLQRRASHGDRFGKIRRSGWREPKYVLGAEIWGIEKGAKHERAANYYILAGQRWNQLGEYSARHLGGLSRLLCSQFTLL